MKKRTVHIITCALVVVLIVSGLSLSGLFKNADQKPENSVTEITQNSPAGVSSNDDDDKNLPSANHVASRADDESSDNAKADEEDVVAKDAQTADGKDVYEKLDEIIATQDENAEFDGYTVKLKEPVSGDTDETIDDAIANGTEIKKLEYADGTLSFKNLDDVKKILDEKSIEYIEPDYKVYMFGDVDDSEVKETDDTLASEDTGYSPMEEVYAEAADSLVEANSATEPNDKYYESYQYNVRDLNVPPIWEYGIECQDFDDTVDMDKNGSYDDDDIVVAVIDSGLKDEHEDIDWDRIITGKSFADGTTETNTNDTDGHGTFVTGIIAAIKDNDVGVAGILQRVKVMPIRVFNGESASDSTIVNAINYAAEQKEEFISSNGKSGTNISVINMSLGSSGTSASMNTACQRAIADGILVVCAAGNDGNTAASYPAQYSMGIGSTNNTKNVSSYSQRLSSANGSTYANKVWVTAPGEAVTSLYCESTKSYAQMSGTSFSSPEVAALGAICKSLHNEINQEEFMQLLKDTADYKTGSMGNISGQDVECKRYGNRWWR